MERPVKRARRRTLAALIAATSIIVTIDADGVRAGAVVEAAARSAAAGLGDRGASVIRVQQALIAAGLPLAGGADGYFGPVTKRTLKTFQQARGLTSSGAVDDATVTQLGLTLPVRDERSAGVKRLQELLLAAGLNPPGGADGIFGPGTEAAIRQFQESKGLAPTGAVDDATAVALGFTPAPAGVALAAHAATATATANRGVSPGATSGFARLGDRGAGVTRMQQALIAAGISLTGGADGVFGTATTAALTRYQKALGLSATGALDDATASALGLALPTLGDSGDNVKRLQELLITGGNAIRGGADGLFGPVTATAIKTFQVVNGLPDTGVLDDTTAVKLGFNPLPKTATTGAQTAQPEPTVSITTFPVQGPCGFVDTWMQERPGGRIHQGVDLIAAEGKYVYATAEGTITKRYWDFPGALTGNGLRLSLEDGTYFFYAHLLDVAPGIDVGTKVKAGQIIGFVGQTGNAGTPHLHFEVHPKGGSAVNPYPVVKAVDGCAITDPLPQPA